LGRWWGVGAKSGTRTRTHAQRTKTKTYASTQSDSDQPSSHTPTFRARRSYVGPSITHMHVQQQHITSINHSHTLLHSTQLPAHRLQFPSIPSITSRRLSQSRSRSRSTLLVVCYGPRGNTIAGSSSSLLQEFLLGR
jgi:hypothetical protein